MTPSEREGIMSEEASEPEGDVGARTNQNGRVGLWLVGARGSVATTAVVGLAAVRARLADDVGLVCSHPALADVDLPGLDEIVVGGHDVVDGTTRERAEGLAAGRVFPAALVPATSDELDAYDARIRPGAHAEAPHQRALVEAVAADVREFAAENGCDVVVVVNVSSTEPPVAPAPELDDLALLRAAWDRGESPLPASSVYAAAAFEAGAAFVDFTPSAGARLPAVAALAAERGLPWAGSDGKTGETLLKSVLAPMFVQRALRVRSWSGTNLLGGGDGATLADPAARESKTVSKARGLEEITGHAVDGQVHIDYVPDLGDWKTAWDHVSFEGFLGTPMTLQFTWQGCDSALAAPLVLDLARLAALAVRRGESGPLEALGFFFKDPATTGGAPVHDLGTQFADLVRWAEGDRVRP